jgi:hypothetical protein
LVSIGLTVSEEKIFEKVYDVRQQRTPSDGNSSPGPKTVKISGFWVITQKLFIISEI